MMTWTLFMREDLHLVRTVRMPRLRGLLRGLLCALAWPTGAAGACVALFVAMQWVDDTDATRHALAAEQRAAELRQAYEQGRSQGHAEMVATAEAGWQAARTEATRRAPRAATAATAANSTDQRTTRKVAP